VVHVDCDAFYAAVEQLDRPELKDVPFAVGKGVLTTCNYHARTFGCRSGMAGFVALKLCPKLQLIPLNFEKYTAKAKEVREILRNYDSRFESTSIDEAYLNITSYCEANSISPDEAVEQLRREVHEKTRITISAGIAANAKLAKICSNKNKPNGQFRLANDRATIMAFMRDLPIRNINGVGRVFERELNAVGIETCGDIYNYRQYLLKLFGEKAFIFLIQCYLGLGRTVVQPAEEYERKSIGTESTFAEMSGHVQLREKLREIAKELEEDMLKAYVKARTLVLKVKLHTYEVYTRQVIPPKTIHLADDLYKYAVPMLAMLEQDFPAMRLRLMGLRCTHLVSMRKPNSLAFFGFKTGPNPGLNSETAVHGSHTFSPQKFNLANSDGEWEAWPDEEFEDAARHEHQQELEELETLSQVEDVDAERQHPKDVNPNPKENDMHQQWWDCPICLRPQISDEKDFNDHIDLCLSRQTIREAVQDIPKEEQSPTEGSSGAKKFRFGKRKDRDTGNRDPKQRRLCFNQNI
jgi:DNA polymerase kappa